MSKLIHTMCNHHFCIKNSDIELISKSLITSNLERIIFKRGFEWADIYQDESNLTFLIIEGKSEWSYLIFNIWDFNLIKSIMKELSKELNTVINYFFINPWITTTRWIIVENGKVIRSLWKDYETVLENNGNLTTEDELKGNLLNPDIREIEEIDNEQLEIQGIDICWDEIAKLYWNLISKLSYPLYKLNEGIEYNAIKGELHKNYLQQKL